MGPNLADRQLCCGCSACAAACLHGCISMEEDGEGFLRPQVDESACIGCGLCEEVCPVCTPRACEGARAPEAWTARADDIGLRLASSSGGVFTLLARQVLRAGGVVFGAAMTADLRGVHHIPVECEEDLAALRGSKYLQSDMEDCFRRAEELLEDGRAVLFTGTPCQIEGVRAFLGRTYPKLLLAQIVCHGVPSPALWRSYLTWEEQRAKAPVESVSFRYKPPGGKGYLLRIEPTSGTARCYQTAYHPYFRMFLRDQCLRPSCYQCFAKGLNGSADLTLGDFWGIEKAAPELDDGRGVSLVLLHTAKGCEAFDRLRPELTCRGTDLTAALAGNLSMLRSAPRPHQRETFFTDLARLPFPTLARWYVPVTTKERALAMLRNTGLLPLAARLLRK